MNIWIFTALLFVLGSAWGLGKASVFKSLADDYPKNLGVASGIVGLAGGMGGFLLPILFGFFIDITRINSSIFMLLYGATCVSLILMYFTFGKDHAAKVILQTKEAIKDQETLRSIEAISDTQHKTIAKSIRSELNKYANSLSWLLDNKKALEAKIKTLQNELSYSKTIYVLDAEGVQITANLTVDGFDDESLGRDRSTRPYLEGMFADEDFKLSACYISKNKKRPSLTAIHVIRNHKHTRLGFLGVDYDLSDLSRNSVLNT